jgi:uncharacterized protein involved in type VI secretion and phage assembly
VSVSGVGDRFAGTYVITSVTHVFVGGRGYQTHFTISGRAARSLLALVERGRPAAPWGGGTVVGVVTQTEDPDGLGRIRVRHPALGDNAEGWWARIASTAAGQARGLLMMPVAGDEVVVAFEQGDPRRPYVLGSVWNGTAKPGEDLVKPDGSFALASDHGVTITAAEDATITATQKALTLKGNQVTAQSDAAFKISGATVTIESNGAVSIKGASITVEAQAALTLKASGAMQVSAATVMFQ